MDSVEPVNEMCAPTRTGGFIIWLTGLSGAGKTTIARAVRGELISDQRAEVLDGDEMRGTLCRGLGYSKIDRETNIFRIGHVARFLARNGVATIVSTISPYRAGRDAVRSSAGAEGIPFLEVFLDTPLDVLIARDEKGLYRKAISGELPHFTGVSDPYERPAAPDLIFRTDNKTVRECVDGILKALCERHLLSGITASADQRPL